MSKKRLVFNTVGKMEPEKVLRVKAFDIASSLGYDGYQCGLASMVYKLYDESTHIGRGIYGI